MTDPCLPSVLVAGDRWSWADAAAFTAYPDPYWSLSYVLRPQAGGATLVFPAVPGLADYAVTVAAATTAGIAPGVYVWAAIATDVSGSGDRVTYGQGLVTVAPDPMTATGDARTIAERTLDAIEATIEGRAIKDADSYTIEGRSLTRTPMADLLRLRALYRRQVAAERNPGASPITYRRVQL